MGTNLHRPTIWVDVEDLFLYVMDNPRPSGIQRLAFEIQGQMQALAGHTGQLRFVRHDDADLLTEVPWQSVTTLFETLARTQHPAPPVARPPPPPPPPPLPPSPKPVARVRRLPLPANVTEPLEHAQTLQGSVVQEFLALLRRLSAPLPRAPLLPESPPELCSEPAPVPTPGPNGFTEGVTPGDVLLILGAPWVHPDYDERLRGLKTRHGMRVAILFYDLIPLRRPEWCVQQLVVQFGAQINATLPLCDILFAISRFTARDVEAYASERGVALPGPVRILPVGTGFGLVERAASASETPPPGLPAPGSYVLFVSTMEARKNHIMLFRLWRRLMEQRGPEHTVQLVFAGRIGWLVADLRQQLENTSWLGGKIRLVRDPSDADLRALYRGCLFTIFPSLYEGWGLPVTESLALGKPCLSSSKTALPEAGGMLTRYFDPDDMAAAMAAVTAILDDLPGLHAWERQVRQEFRPVSWQASAEALLAGLRVTTDPARA